ncbi:MAG: radical SAM protein [Candidatus Omnitrophota bacterium]
MTILNNINFIRQVEDYLSEHLPIRLGVNKKNELVRLVYELCRANDMSLQEVTRQAGIAYLAEEGKSELFHKVKSRLLELRYPSKKEDDDPHIMPFTALESIGESMPWDFDIKPKRAFIEQDVQDLEWTSSFMANFPDAEVTLVDDAKGPLRSLSSNPLVTQYNSRCENVFVVKNKAAFVKICPCTKKALRCGYTILNLGFGCAIDCSYCYLQLYSNFPGLIFPANIEDYYPHIKDLDKKVSSRTRIGTGEFTDSLFLDKYTGYSTHLVPFFKGMKNLVLELKTKAGDIDNVLKQDAHDNVVVSWSMNAREMAEKYEKGAITIDERIDAVRQVVKKGFKTGFHFDPIIFYEGWEDEYKAVVEEIFSDRDIARNTAWVSFGTLRYTPGLKQVAEQRFTDNGLYYTGEFFADVDGKLRYPRELRIEMYNKMIEWIRSYDTSAWIYLCMEPEDLWEKTILTKEDYSYNCKRRG